MCNDTIFDTFHIFIFLKNISRICQSLSHLLCIFVVECQEKLLPIERQIAKKAKAKC